MNETNNSNHNSTGGEEGISGETKSSAGGGVTLHGEPIDLSHLFGASSVFASSNGGSKDVGAPMRSKESPDNGGNSGEATGEGIKKPSIEPANDPLHKLSARNNQNDSYGEDVMEIKRDDTRDSEGDRSDASVAVDASIAAIAQASNEDPFDEAIENVMSGGYDLRTSAQDDGVAISANTTPGSANINGSVNCSSRGMSWAAAAAAAVSTFSLEEQTSSSNLGSNSLFENFSRFGLAVKGKGRKLYDKIANANARNYFLKTQISAANPTSEPGESTSRYHRLQNSRSNGRKDPPFKQLTQSSRLATTSSTPLVFKLLIPPFLLFNHLLFYHGQTQPMWNLSYNVDVSVTATANTLKSKASFDALNLPHTYHYKKKESEVVETFTYMDAIRKLWKAEGLGEPGSRTVILSKVAAALLVVFSGIWPHLKLILVHFCWFWSFAHGVWMKNFGNDEDEEMDEGEEDGEDVEEVYFDGTGTSTAATRDHEFHSNQQCCNTNRSRRICCSPSPNKPQTCCVGPHPHQSFTSRTPFLRILSTFGKWSLADVLVVCILIAVLHLDWQVHPEQIRSGVEQKLPDILQYLKGKYPDNVVDCTQLLGYQCGVHALVIHYPACLACQTLIGNAYNHPQWATSEGRDILDGVGLEGGGYANLRVAGMIGTYYFCAAVVMSILLGIVVDWMDEGDRMRIENELVARKKELEMVSGESRSSHVSGRNEPGHDLEFREEGMGGSLNEALLLDTPTANHAHHRRSHHSPATPYSPSNNHFSYDSNTNNALNHINVSVKGHYQNHLPSPTTNSYLLKQTLLVILSVASLPLVYYATHLPTMQRLVYGGGPRLLHQVLGMVWRQDYSLISLVQTTGDAGGWDLFLMATFGLFVVVGPFIRSICLLLHLIISLPVFLLGECLDRPRQRTTLKLIMYRVLSVLHNQLRPAIDALGAFCSWEVFIVALIMIQLEMPSITDTIYQDDRCKEADPTHGRTCIEVQFNALDNFLVVGVAWAVLVMASGLTMDLARSNGGEDGVGLGGRGIDTVRKRRLGGEARYEFGQPIPSARGQDQSSDRATTGVGNNDRSGFNGGIGGGINVSDSSYVSNNHQEHLFTPLQREEQGGGDEAKDGLDEIVFV